MSATTDAGRFLLRPLFRLVVEQKSTDLFMAACLLVIAATAQISMAAGLSMALGAFLAGVLLADSEYRSELEADIEPFKGLLLGLFFMSVGMGLNLSGELVVGLPGGGGQPCLVTGPHRFRDLKFRAFTGFRGGRGANEHARDPRLQSGGEDDAGTPRIRITGRPSLHCFRECQAALPLLGAAPASFVDYRVTLAPTGALAVDMRLAGEPDGEKKEGGDKPPEAGAPAKAGAPVKLAGYVRMQLGEGIEIEKEDFAAEVAKAANG